MYSLTVKNNLMQTPYYYYNLNILEQTLQAIKAETDKSDSMSVHYAIKANANPSLLPLIRNYGLGIDCVSGGEIRAAINAGFDPSKIVFAGVGKADWEIDLALSQSISCFNVESEAELDVIAERAAKADRIAHVAFRVNPNIDAHTHANITTGLSENKFGIEIPMLEDIICKANKMEYISFEGIHFHIGSQILTAEPFEKLCDTVNTLQDKLETKGITLNIINVGGGLGIDYEEPEKCPIPDFASYFSIFRNRIRLRKGQQLHFELGRSVVAGCGNLITKVLYVKKGTTKNFVIVDAGMTDLIRPALYGAYHKIINLSSKGAEQKYDVVGPICESSDVFVKEVELPETKRGDYLAILSAGAYGEVMASQYNLRSLPGTSTTLELE
jgi:diaminopimelate decarboxylase